MPPDLHSKHTHINPKFHVLTPESPAFHKSLPPANEETRKHSIPIIPSNESVSPNPAQLRTATPPQQPTTTRVLDGISNDLSQLSVQQTCQPNASSFTHNELTWTSEMMSALVQALVDNADLRVPQTNTISREGCYVIRDVMGRLFPRRAFQFHSRRQIDDQVERLSKEFRAYVWLMAGGVPGCAWSTECHCFVVGDANGELSAQTRNKIRRIYQRGRGEKSNLAMHMINNQVGFHYDYLGNFAKFYHNEWAAPLVEVEKATSLILNGQVEEPMSTTVPMENQRRPIEIPKGPYSDAIQGIYESNRLHRRKETIQATDVLYGLLDEHKLTDEIVVTAFSIVDNPDDHILGAMLADADYPEERKIHALTEERLSGMQRALEVVKEKH